jgi:hypothetical protein
VVVVRWIALLLSAGIATLAFAGQAWGEMLVVTNTTDANAAPAIGACFSGFDCSLREAMTDANSNTETPGADTILLPPGTYTLTNNALPEIPGDVTVEGTSGASATTITGAVTNAPVVNQKGGVFSVNGASAKLTLRGVTLRDNKLTGTASVGGGAIAAGGGATLVLERAVVRNNRSEATSTNSATGGIAGDGGSLTLTDSAVEDNVFAGTGSPDAAGGISFADAGLVVSRSSISRNHVVDPTTGSNSSAVGGLELNVGTSLSIADSTVSENSVSAGGATSFRTGGLDTNNVGDVTLTNVTVTDNVAGAGGGTVVGQISLFGTGTRVVRNTIVAGGAPVNCHTAGLAISSSGGNLEDANTCHFTGADLIDTDPQLAALGNNGGLGLTSTPLISSPAFGLARPEFCSANDQRGVARPQGGACDSGGVESATPPVNTALPSITGTAASGQTLTCDPGAFTQDPTFAFQWLSAGASISGATATEFTVTDAQLGSAVQCQVTATNIAAQTVATSTAVVPPKPPVVSPPVSTARPSFTGKLRTGKTLTCAPGTFSGVTTIAFAWLRDGAAIAGANTATYKLTKNDARKAIQCSVTATGPGGSAVAESAPGQSADACIVPKLVGKALAAASKALRRANCALGETKERRSTEEPGTVLSSSPARGENRPAGKKVALTLAE